MSDHVSNELAYNDVQSDYLEYFFIRSKADNGFVMTVDTQYGFMVPKPMMAHNRGLQLFKVQPISETADYVQIINQQTQQALTINYNGLLVAQASELNNPLQQWAISADNQFLTPVQQGQAITYTVENYNMNPVISPADSTQQFELFYPSDFVYIRNCWTGRFLTADLGTGVGWSLMDPIHDDLQQWGVTEDGVVVNRGNGQVLQRVAGQGTLQTGPQKAIGTDGGLQGFNLNSLDGAIHSKASDKDVLTQGPGGEAIMVASNPADHTQLAEPISPFQFFSLECGCYYNNQQPWLVRSGNSAQVAFQTSAAINQIFTVSRFGEIISPVDGFVLQSQGAGQIPTFVDPAPEAIGYDSTTFVYNQVPSSFQNYGSITLRSGSLGLISYGGKTCQPWMYGLGSPVTGNQVWQMVGASGTIFAQYQSLAEAFFSDPAPLPGQAALEVAEDKTVTALVGALDKTTQVIITLITGILDIACGVTVGKVADDVAGKVAGLILGSKEVAARVAVLMQGTVTAASVIAVADGITKAGLWMKLFKMLLPNSFWGWTLTICKLSLTIAAWALGAGPAITGAKIALLVADIIRILAENVEAVEKEEALLTTHVVKTVAAAPVVTQTVQLAPAKIEELEPA